MDHRRALPGDEYDRAARVNLPKEAQGFQAGHVRQMNVENDDIGSPLAGDGQAGGGRLRCQHRDLVIPVRTTEGQQDARFVIYHEKSRQGSWNLNGELSPDAKNRCCRHIVDHDMLTQANSLTSTLQRCQKTMYNTLIGC